MARRETVISRRANSQQGFRDESFVIYCLGYMDAAMAGVDAMSGEDYAEGAGIVYRNQAAKREEEDD